MTLDKHRIDGLQPITSKTLPADQFNELLRQFMTKFYSHFFYPPLPFAL